MSQKIKTMHFKNVINQQKFVAWLKRLMALRHQQFFF